MDDESFDPQNLSAALDAERELAMLQAILQNVRTQTVVLSITMVIALVGNLFLAFLITKMSRRRLGPVQILILHTCAADICFALCTALPQMASTLTFPHFYGGDFLCRLVKYLQLIPMYASPYLLVAISIDRYVAICKPLLALKWKYGLVHTLAAVAWTLSLLFSVPNIFNFQYGLLEKTHIMACLSRLGPEFEQAWISVFALLVWLLPSSVVGVLYALVCATVWRSMRCASDNNTSWPNDNNNENQLPQRRHSYAATHSYTVNANANTVAGAGTMMRKSYTPSINSYKLKTVKLTMTIVIANFVLWAPFCIINVVGSYFPHIDIDDIVATCIILVGNANSCVNPWIYVIFNYKRVKEVLCGGTRRSSSSRYRDLISSMRARAPAPTKGGAPPDSAYYLDTNRCYDRNGRDDYRKSSVNKNNNYLRSNSVAAMKRYSLVSDGSLNSAF